MTKVGRNDPCPCGSGKKYKQCCLQKPVLARKKITPTVLKTQPKPIDLMERTFGNSIAKTYEESSQEQNEQSKAQDAEKQ